jgi:type IV secretory pathway component VirB8
VHRNRERFYRVLSASQAFLVRRTIPVAGVASLHQKQGFLVRFIDSQERIVLKLLIGNKAGTAC